MVTIKEVDEFLKLYQEKPSTEYTRPRRKLFLQDFLTHIEITHSEEVMHVYEPEAPICYDGDPDFILVVHNHPSDMPCYSRDLCFAFGYAPVETDHPGFRRMFWERNGKYYGKEISSGSRGLRKNDEGTKGNKQDNAVTGEISSPVVSQGRPNFSTVTFSLPVS